MQKTIQKIHRKFDTASEKILSEAKKLIAGKPEVSYSERLKGIGFIKSNGTANGKNFVRSRQLISLIQEYSIAYPNYKFITEEIVNKICEKYGLLFSVISNYIGDVPEKNLAEIETFVSTHKIIPEIKSSSWLLGSVTFWINGEPDEFQEPTSREFKIVAPEKDFNLENKTRKGYELINDPIVLYPVKGGYMIVTKWGLEGNDESLINEKHN